MRKDYYPEELAEIILKRSVCHVMVGAVIADAYGILAWGPNHIGFDGLGCHAEAYALSRANRRRLSNATLYVAAKRKKSGSVVTAKPCENCALLLRRVRKVMYRDGLGNWCQL